MTANTKKPFSWSHSALNQYETCPYRYYRTRITKDIVEPQSEQIVWGNRVHKALENNITYKEPLTSEFTPYQKVLDTLKKIPGQMVAEQKLAVDRDLKPADFDSSTAWCRCVTDVLIINQEIACAFDWKTGKIKYDFEQLRLNALLIFANFPQVQLVKGAYIWLKERQITKDEFPRWSTNWDKYKTSVRFMENSYEQNFWPKRKSGLCKNWCPVTSCEYNGKYRG